MKPKPLRISIPSPCQEDWNAMTPQTDGSRHCDTCARNIVDFTYLNDREIHRYVQDNNGRICGRWRKDQLDRPIVADLPARPSFTKVAATAAGLMLSAGLSAQLAPGPENTDTPVRTEQVTEHQDHPEKPLVGEISIEPLPPPAPQITVTGTVYDSDQAPLIGATVLIVGKNSGTVTDLDGRYSLEVESGSELRITYPGFQDTLFQIPSDINANELNLATQLRMGEQLDEVVVLGYIVSNSEHITTTDLVVIQPEDEEPEIDATELKADLNNCLPGATIFPNPFYDFIGLEITPLKPIQLQAKLFDLDGRLVRSWAIRELAAIQQEVKLGLRYLDLVPGHYYLLLEDGNGHTETRVVIRRRP